MRTRRPLPFALLAIAVLASACSVTHRSARRYEITQRAALPAPGGPEAVGTLTPSRTVSVQGGARVVHARQASGERERAELGHLVTHRTFHGRLGLGLMENVELGLSGTYGNIDRAVATSDLSPGPSQLQDRHLFWGGAQLRAIPLGDRRNGLALLGEASVGSAPSERRVRVTSTDALATDLGEVAYTRESSYREQRDEVHVIWRAGLQGFASVGAGLTLHGGAMAQSYPRYWAQRVVGQTCEDELFDDQPASCQGDTPGTINAWNDIWLGTAFAGASFHAPDLPISVHGQLFYHALAPSHVRQTTPAGGDLALRLTF